MAIITKAGTVRKDAMGWTITTPDAKWTSTVYLAKNGTDLIRSSGAIVTTLTANQVASFTAPVTAKVVAPTSHAHSRTNAGASAMTRNGRGEWVSADLAEWEY
jgi:hypothetical protein